MPGARTFAASNFMLELEGVKCGFVRSVEGGTVSAPVVREERGRGRFVKKHLAQPVVEPFAVSLGVGLEKSLYAWISEAFAGTQRPRSGAVVAADASFTAKERREFEDALITEVTLPAMDGASKDAAFMTVRFAAASVSQKKASGKVQAPAAKAKAWLGSNFRLEIDGLDCKRVSRIGGLAVRCGPPVDVGDLRIMLAETGAQTWVDWHRKFVVDGQNADGDEREGTIDLLAANLKDALGQIRLFGLGIYRLAPLKQDAGGQAVSRLAADLYCERMELSIR